MAFASGSRFGPYEVAARIGAGGMGEVYRARDTRLNRDVAIKILPDQFAADAERRARFEREARVLAMLNHPGIAQVYGVEDVDGVTALVMELVEGPTLADRIARGPLGMDEAFEIARQLTRALEAAHAHHIVHRDLKPANIKVREDGTVKVLDFGLAKAIEPADDAAVAETPTITSPTLTARGVILGTAAYMSPEQARGRAADARADIWAFGCVCYEMLTARRAFDGADVSEVLAAVIKSEPDWTALPPMPPIHAVFLRRCLEKDPRQRVHDIADVRLALEGAFEIAGTAPAPAATRVSPWRLALPVAAAVLLTGVVAWGLRPTAEAPAITRFRHDLPSGQELRAAPRALTISPDGRAVVYCTRDGLYLRSMDALEAVRIAGVDSEVRNPFFSPNGRNVAYWSSAAGEIRYTSIEGGAAIPIARTTPILGADWSDERTILYGQEDGIYQLAVADGTQERIIATQDDERVYGPQLLPGGQWVLFTVTKTGNWTADSQVVAQSLATGDRIVVARDGHGGRYVPTGHVLYAIGQTLFAVPFDAKGLTATGGAQPVLEDVMVSGGAAQFDVSSTGTLASVSADPGRTLVWVNRSGLEEPVPITPAPWVYARLSPDGTRAALNDRAGDNGIWIWDFAARTLTKLTTGPRGGYYPVWNADSSRVAYNSLDGNIVWKAADNTDAPEVLTTLADAGLSPYFLVPDGGLVIRHPRRGIWIARPGADTPTALIEESDGTDRLEVQNAELSPNGRWLAYQARQSGRFEVYVRPFPNVNDARVPISTAGGIMPRWSPDGTELFYIEAPGPLEGGVMMSASVEPGAPTLTVNARSKVLDWPYPSFVIMRTYDVSHDGQRFLAIKRAGSRQESGRQIVIVQHWFQELLAARR